MSQSHEYWMARALNLARQAAEHGEVPVGAVVVRADQVVGEGFNQPISARDPTAHAEVVALRDAAAGLGNYRLAGCRLYVTIEPCTMCVGALIHARIAELIFGAREARAGAVCSNLQLPAATIYNHHLAWREGVLAEDCGLLLRDFFRARR